MFSDAISSWLLFLSDPEPDAAQASAVHVPRKRLNAAQAIELWALARQHGVTGAVSARWNSICQRAGQECIVSVTDKQDIAALAQAIGAARADWFGFVASALFLRSRTCEVLAAFERQGISAIVIKGEDFADRLYRQPGLRPFRDIDLLLSPDDYRAANDMLPRLGFRASEADLKHSEGYGEISWTSTTPPEVSLETHWNLINSPAQRRQTSVTLAHLALAESTVNGRRSPRPTPASLLLMATVHAVLGHRFDRLQQLCDIRQICRGAAGSIDEAWLREAARETGATTALAAGLEVTSRLLGDADSAGLLQRLRLQRPHGIQAGVSRWLVGPQTLLHPEAPFSKFRRTLVREWMKRAA